MQLLYRYASAPGTIPGDIVFVVQEKEHALFKRKGPDLFLEKSISLTEALCGGAVQVAFSQPIA
jgi:DnaJ-class molecular chaperone